MKQSFRTKKINLFTWVPLLFFLMGFFLLFWIDRSYSLSPRKATGGVLHLEGYSFKERKNIPLNGEWEFYPGQLLFPGDFESPLRGKIDQSRDYITVPGPWDKHILPDGTRHPETGYATYRLMIKKIEPYLNPALTIPSQKSAYSVFVNGIRIFQSGQPGVTKDSEKPFLNETVVPLSKELFNLSDKEDNQIEIIFQISNFHSSEGGMINSLYLGDRDTLLRRKALKSSFHMIVIGGFLSIGVYVLTVFIMIPRKKECLAFSLLIFVQALRLLITKKYLFILFTMPNLYSISIRFTYITLFLTVITIIFYFSMVFHKDKITGINYTIYFLMGGLSLWSLVAPIPLVEKSFCPFSFLAIPILAYSLYITLRAFHYKTFGARTFLVCIIITAISGLADIFRGYIQNYYPFQSELFPLTIMTLIINQAIILTIDIFSSYMRNKNLSRELVEEKTHIEEIVEERTRELAETNRKLKKEEHLKTLFVSNITHELKTPLSLINMPLEAILQGYYGETLSIDSTILKTLYTNGQNLNKLVDDLAHYSQIKSEDIILDYSAVDIIAMIKVLMAGFELKLREKNIILIFDNQTEKEKHFISVDRILLERSLINILNNAQKYTEKGSISVTLSQNKETEELIISIEDTGIGIPEHMLDEIFEHFTRVEETKEKYEGCGIGLFLVKKNLEALGGSVKVESRLHKGSRFTVTIPDIFPEESPL